MRVGFNPNKDKQQQHDPRWHQVVIPVYIPHDRDYFKDSFKVFKLSLESLIRTVHTNTFISVVNNGSAQEVQEYLDQKLAQGSIHELIHSDNIGKINAVLKGVGGHNFQLITIADADVFFHNNWQSATYDIFKAFPKAGAVAPLSFPSFLKYFTAPVWADHWATKRLRFANVIDQKGLRDFSLSINNPNFYKEVHLKKQLVLRIGNTIAAVGSGHFVNTYRASIFNPPAASYSPFHLGGGSETKFVDAPVVQAGGYRLATLNVFASHMGNTYSEEFQQRLGDLTSESEQGQLSLQPLQINSVKRGWNRLIFRLITTKPLWRLLLRRKGLTTAEAKAY